MGCGGSKTVDAMVTSFLFQPPDVASYTETSFKGELIWVPIKGEESKKDAFPCRLLQVDKAAYLILYFKRNGDDIGSCRWFCEKLKNKLRLHVLAVEYPGYGLCTSQPTVEGLMVHATSVPDFHGLSTVSWSLGRAWGLVLQSTLPPQNQSVDWCSFPPSCR